MIAPIAVRRNDTGDDPISSPTRTGATGQGKGKGKEKVEIIGLLFFPVLLFGFLLENLTQFGVDLTMDDDEGEKESVRLQPGEEDDDKLWVDKYSPRNVVRTSPLASHICTH